MDKTISKDNTHRVGEGKVHNSIYDMNKLQHQREKRLGMKPFQSRIVKCSSKGLSFFFKRKQKYENSYKYLGLRRECMYITV